MPEDEEIKFDAFDIEKIVLNKKIDVWNKYKIEMILLLFEIAVYCIL